MKLTMLRPALLLLLATGCNSFLDVNPINEIPEESAITNRTGALSAVAGMYDALQDGSYYGGDFVFFGDLSAEDVEHTGTFTTYRQIDQNDITSDNGGIEDVWDALYFAIGRANIVLARVPGVAGLDPAERDQMLGEAHFIRALTYHNLVKFWGEQGAAGMGVPLVLVPPVDIPSASQVTRATTGAVYTQILSDLAQAEALLSTPTDSVVASVGAVRALRARVYLYQQNYAAAEAQAESVTAMGYALAGAYGDLFGAEGSGTDEDIFLTQFTATEFNFIGYYYRANGAGGRREITPSQNLLWAYDPDSSYDGTAASYSSADLRGQWNVAFRVDLVYGSKWPTGIGAEDIHVIRYAEVLLIQAEAEARQNKLGEAEATITPVRTRAGMPALGLDVLTQQQAIDAILEERRFELAYEGDRFPDLVRTGRAVAVLALAAKAHQVLYPIPLNELDVAPGLVQNPGY